MGLINYLAGVYGATNGGEDIILLFSMISHLLLFKKLNRTILCLFSKRTVHAENIWVGEVSWSWLNYGLFERKKDVLKLQFYDVLKHPFAARQSQLDQFVSLTKTTSFFACLISNGSQDVK